MPLSVLKCLFLSQLGLRLGFASPSRSETSLGCWTACDSDCALEYWSGYSWVWRSMSRSMSELWSVCLSASAMVLSLGYRSEC